MEVFSHGKGKHLDYVNVTRRKLDGVSHWKVQNSRSPAIRDGWVIAKSFRTTITTMPSPGKISRGGVRPFADNTNGLVSGKIVIAMCLQNSVSASSTDGQVNVCKHHEESHRRRSRSHWRCFIGWMGNLYDCTWLIFHDYHCISFWCWKLNAFLNFYLCNCIFYDNNFNLMYLLFQQWILEYKIFYFYT